MSHGGQSGREDWHGADGIASDRGQLLGATGVGAAVGERVHQLARDPATALCELRRTEHGQQELVRAHAAPSRGLHSHGLAEGDSNPGAGMKPYTTSSRARVENVHQ